MRYTDSQCAYRLLGVYHIHRPPRETENLPRDFIGIGYRIQGSSQFSYQKGSFYAGTGSTLFLPDKTAFRNKNTEPEELVIVHLQPLGPTPKDFRLYPDTQSLEPVFRKLYDCWQAGRYNRCMSTLYALLDALESPESALPSVIAPGVALLRRNFRDPELTVAQAAQACFVSQVYFRRIYRQHFGVSPLQDILRLRFEYATQLLRSGYYTQEEIAQLSGFSDVKYFRTAFTKYFHLSPTQWQRQNRL